MAYISYGQDTAGGKQLAEAFGDLQQAINKVKALAAWVNQIGPGGLEANTDFSVGAGEGQAFNDTFLQIDGHCDDFMTAAGEKIARLARGW